MKKIILVCLLVFLLSGCGGQAIATETVPVNTLETTAPVISSAIFPTIETTPLIDQITATPSAQAQSIAISTPIDWSSEGNNSSFVPERVNHNIKPTNDLRQLITVTPSRPEQCPNEKPNLVLNEEVLDNSLPYVDNEMTVLDFMNSGGTPQAVIEALFREMEISGYYLNQDLTGDGIPELAITYTGYLYIFGCKSGKYVTTLKILNAISGFPIFIGPAKDLNLNGIPEIILSTTTCNGPCTEVRIFEWDGNQYRSLLRTQFYGYLFDYAQIYKGTISIQDLDGNGFLDMILDGGIPTQMAALANGFPFRHETQIFSWNGMVFEQTSQQYGPPQYRFQAVQDGDRASLAGEYEEAVAYYQQAIFSDELDWWSAERREFILETQYSYASGQTSTPIPPESDPNEYYNLAAYSRYRIMLIYVVRGWLPEAETVYNTMREKFAVGQAGSAYAEMATTFWKEYQASHDIGLACEQAIEYAKAHPAEILTYLGNSDFGYYYGDQSLTYKPEDICPFR